MSMEICLKLQFCYSYPTTARNWIRFVSGLGVSSILFSTLVPSPTENNLHLFTREKIKNKNTNTEMNLID